MGSTALRELERKLEGIRAPSRRADVFRARPEATPTGIPPLDDILPEGGLPRGRAVEWRGPRSCGKTAVLRATLGRLHASGEGVAVVDPTRSLYAPDWAELAGRVPFWVVRPPRPSEAPWCADLLLRSGAFGAVALETGPAVPPGDSPRRSSRSRGRRPGSGSDLFLSRAVTVRLQRLAEEAGAIFVVVGELPLAALRLRFRPGRLEPVTTSPLGPLLPLVRPVWAGVESRGEREVPILCPVPPDRPTRRAARDRKGRR